MLGIRTNCELIHAYLGAYAGLFAAIIMLTSHAPLTAGGIESIQLSLLTAAFAILFTTFQFSILYRQAFFPFLVSVLLPGLIYGFLLYHLMLVMQPYPEAQPLLLMLLGALLGVALGRVLCAACGKTTVTLTHKG